MEEVDDEDLYLHSMAPLKKSRIIELSDGSEDNDDDGGCPPLQTVDNKEDSDDEGDSDDEEVIEEPEESAEAELGE